jgi:glutaminyl-peptide cyclotransferase
MRIAITYKTIMKNIIPITLLLTAIVGTTIVSWQKFITQLPAINQKSQRFSGERALQNVEYQISLGPRIPATQGHRDTISWIFTKLAETGWEAEIQQGEMLGQTIQNVIGKRDGVGDSNRSWIIIGAHFDTRIYADEDPDPDKRTQPVPGANDGASGVAVLLELARILPVDLKQDIWLVFFDAEDNGNIPGWDWIMGSRYFVNSLQGKPNAAIIVDMIGDADLNIYLERGSDKELSAEIWSVAADLGYSQFIPFPKYNILDDHVPFLEAGIRAIDIIDFDYPYWHTTEDTLDKVSSESLEAVGETLRVWLLRANH